MPRYTRVLLHSDGPSFWPFQRSNEAVLELKARTPANIWAATYQGVPTSPGGSVFYRSWWEGKNRYDPGDDSITRRAIRRWLSVDSAGTDGSESAFTCILVMDMLPDYRVLVREVYRERILFPSLVPTITRIAKKWYLYDRGKTLAAVMIENESTGTPAMQVMQATSEPWLAEMLWSVVPEEDKEYRARHITPWCMSDCVLLPEPSEALTVTLSDGTQQNWLPDFEEELFDFPESAFSDQIDAFSQIMWGLRNYIQEGMIARRSAAARQAERLLAEAAGIPWDGTAMAGRGIG
jgi:predicted phage terminase large subunit-like protein